ncbi:MAG: hypothetical protein FJ147_06780 [Deltaproteobacteria bacterium]|nr:hypothetical protein [Deltaproteobacteria bacterium]
MVAYFGEPLAHPHFRQCLEILHGSQVARNALVIQHTNASLLKGDKARALLDIPIVKKLVFSFDGFGDKERFECLRGPHYEQVLANIRAFSQEAKKQRPDLLLTTCTILPREGEIPGLIVPSRVEAFQRLEATFAPLGVSVETRDMHGYSGNDELPIHGKLQERVFGGCNFIEGDSLYFTVNGWAQPCCAVYNETFNVGGFPEQDFGSLLNNSSMQRIRHAVRMDRRAEIPCCQNCTLSLGTTLPEHEFHQFWLARDRTGAIADMEERQYILEKLASADHVTRSIDLGCNGVKHDQLLEAGGGQQELQQQLSARTEEIAQLQTVLAEQSKETERLQSDLRATQGRLLELEQQIRTQQQRLTEQQEELMGKQVLYDQLQGKVAAVAQQLARFEIRKPIVSAELTALRQRRTTRWLSRFQLGGDLREAVAPAFQQLKDDSLHLTPHLKGYRLQPSTDLRFVPFLTYPLELQQSHFNGLLLAPILDLPASQGSLGIEIVSPANIIMLHTLLPLVQIDEQAPTHFTFSPIADSQQGRFWLRVFVRDAIEPVRIFEWRKYRFGRFGYLQTRAFCGVNFA